MKSDLSLNEFVEKKKLESSTASKFGYHYISEFMKNPWNFYLRHVVGLNKVEKKPALSLGTGIHLFAEIWFKFQNESYQARNEAWESLTSAYDLDEKSRVVLHYMKNLWLDKYAQLPDIYECVASELPLTYRLPNGFEMTGAADRVYKLTKASERKFVLVETKTTGWQLDAMFRQVSEGDQIVLYSMALEQMGYPIAYVLPEIIYATQRSNMSKPSGKAETPATIEVSEVSKKRLALNLVGMWGRLYQALKSLDLYPPEMIFPRNPSDVAQFGDPMSEVKDLAKKNFVYNEKNVDYFKRFGWEMKDHSEKLQDFINAWEATEDYDFMYKRLSEVDDGK